jgi:hypothetical protein
MLTITFLTGLVSSLLIYPALIALASWLAGHVVRAIVTYVPRVKSEHSIPFRISYWLTLSALALGSTPWVFLVLNHLSAPRSWWGEQSHWWMLMVTVFYLLPIVLAWALWERRGGWVHLAVVTVSLLYFGWCSITFQFGLGYFFFPAAAFLLAASALRLFAPPTAANTALYREGGT